MESAVHKLSHPLEEIRVRALHAITAKVSCGIWPSLHSLPSGIKKTLAEALCALANDYPEAQTLLNTLEDARMEDAPRKRAVQIEEEAVERPVDMVESGEGWCFPQVELCERDDKALLELEVKIKLQSSAIELLKLLKTFQQTVLLDFPPEVFLQRPIVLEYLLHLVSQPVLEKKMEFGQAYFEYPKACVSAKLVLISLDIIKHFISAWTTSFHLHVNGSYTAIKRDQDSFKYPTANSRLLYGGWSYSGALRAIASQLLTTLLQPNTPQAQIVSLVTSISTKFLSSTPSKYIAYDDAQHLVEKLSNVLATEISGDLAYPLIAWLVSLLECVEYHNSIVLPSTLCDIMEIAVLDDALFDSDKELQMRLEALLAKFRPDAIKKIAEYTRMRELQSKHDSFLSQVDKILELDDQEQIDENILVDLLSSAESLMDLLPSLGPTNKAMLLLTAFAHVICRACTFKSLHQIMTRILERMLTFLPSSNTYFDVIYSYKTMNADLEAILSLPQIALGLCQCLTVSQTSECLWDLVHDALSRGQISSNVLPYLQHWAYAEVPLTEKHAEYQEDFAEILHGYKGSDELLSRARCLFHSSEYIRRAAVAGLNELLGLACVDDIFMSEELESNLLNYFQHNHCCTTMQPKNDSKLVEKFTMWLSMLESESLDIKIKSTALSQIAEKLNNITDVSLLISSGVLRYLFEYLLCWLKTLPSCSSAIMLVLEGILLKSRAARDWVRQNDVWLAELISYALKQGDAFEPAIYCCLLYVTCSLEVWASISEDLVTFPKEIHGTFEFRLAAVATKSLLPKVPASIVMQSISSRPRWISSVPSQTLQELESAQSHRDYANRLYNIIWLCQLHPHLFASAVSNSPRVFLRFFDTYPCSSKDFLTLSAILETLASIIPKVDDAASLVTIVLVRLRAHIISIIRQNNSLYNEMVKLFLAVANGSKSMALLVAAFIQEVDLVAYIQLNGLVLHASGTETSAVVRTLKMLILLTQAEAEDSKWLALMSESLVPPVLNLFQRQCQLDSFHNKAIVLPALQYLFEITRKIDKQQGDNILDVARRHIFDVDSRIRTLGYKLVSVAKPLDKQLIELADGTATDTKECLAVRDAAMSLIQTELNISKAISIILDDECLTSPSFTLSILKNLDQQRNVNWMSLPWAKLLSIDYYYTCCKNLTSFSTHTRLRSRTSKCAMCLDEHEWQSKHLPVAVSSLRQCLYILVNLDQRPHLTILMPSITKLLQWLHTQPTYLTLLSDVLCLLNVIDIGTALANLPPQCSRSIVEALISVTSNRFQDSSLLEQVLAPSVALLPYLMRDAECSHRAEVLCDQIAAILSQQRSSSSYRLIQIMAGFVAGFASIPTLSARLCAKGIVDAIWLEFVNIVHHLRLENTNRLPWVTLYSDILGCMFAENQKAQNNAANLGLPTFIAENWLLLSKNEDTTEAILGLLVNYVYGNTDTKRSFACEPQAGASKLQCLVWDFALLSQSKRAWTLLKSLHVCVDCVLVSIKRGYVQKVLQALEARLKCTRISKKAAKTPPILPLVDVLANIASFEEGRKEINRFDHLHDVLTDTLNLQLFPAAILWIRYMACATLGKSQLIQWQNILNVLIESLNANDREVVLHASSAIWWLFYRNQRATALLWTKEDWKLSIQEVCAWYQDKKDFLSNEIKDQLENIVRLIELEKTYSVNDNDRDSKPSSLQRIS